MRRIKYLFWIIIAAFLLTFIYQNREFFTVQRAIGIDLHFVKYQTPELATGIYYLVVFLVGFLVAYLVSLSKRFQNRKTIRTLKEKIAADEKRISELENRPAEEPTAAFPETSPGLIGETETSQS